MYRGSSLMKKFTCHERKMVKHMLMTLDLDENDAEDVKWAIDLLRKLEGMGF